jgi:hypothetical protein
MNWKRGSFRVYCVLALLFVLWATDKMLRADPLRNRLSFYDGCSAIQSLKLESAPPGEEGSAFYARASADFQACRQGAVEATPLWGDMIAKYPKDAAIFAAFMLAAPVAVWWLLRGLVALACWIGRGFKTKGA